ncbi:PaaI family thioesterase [Paeniglutamicibacter sp.]|uniref:PaaI family thioesterase n=1 Tax=Paeniglutamicibacter sp. TaxID=1934391 RepID=UPI00398951AC
MALPATLSEFTARWDKFRDSLGFEDITFTLRLSPHAVTEDSMSFSMPLCDGLAQANGMYAAAALFGAADITGTFLAMNAYADAGQFPLAVQSNVNFMSNSKSGPAVATARILRGGSSVVVAEVQVEDADAKVLVHSTFTYVLKERRLGK